MNQREEVDFLLTYLHHHFGGWLFYAHSEVERASEELGHQTNLDRAKFSLSQAQRTLSAISILHLIAQDKPLYVKRRPLRTHDIRHIFSDLVSLRNDRQFVVEVPNVAVPIEADSRLIEIALATLLDDIISLSSEGRSIHLEYGHLQDLAVFSLTYYGQSLAAAEPVNIGGFEMHGPQWYFGDHGSVGIAVSKAISLAHGGRLELGGDSAMAQARLIIPHKAPRDEDIASRG